MSLFDSLLVAHLVGDWLLQTEWQALNKTKNWRAMWAHVAVYHILILNTDIGRCSQSRKNRFIKEDNNF